MATKDQLLTEQEILDDGGMCRFLFRLKLLVIRQDFVGISHPIPLPLLGVLTIYSLENHVQICATDTDGVVPMQTVVVWCVSVIMDMAVLIVVLLLLCRQHLLRRLRIKHLSKTTGH
jgi:hypothetical protein